jgi:hypothetical protein
MTDLLLLHEQARSLGELTQSYAQSLAECAQAGSAYGEALEKLAFKRDPRAEALWETSWHALSLEQLRQPVGPEKPPASPAVMPEGAADAPPPLPAGLSTIQQLLYTLAQGQAAAHSRLMELAESSHSLVSKALEALKESYRSDVRGVNDKYMERRVRSVVDHAFWLTPRWAACSKRRWRYSLSQAVAHRHAPEEATRFETEAAMWRRQWESTSPELVEVARRVKAEHAPKARTLRNAHSTGADVAHDRLRRCWPLGFSCSSRRLAKWELSSSVRSTNAL